MNIDLSRLPSEKPIRPDLNAEHWSYKRRCEILSEYAAVERSDSLYDVTWKGRGYKDSMVLSSGLGYYEATRMVRWCVEHNPDVEGAIKQFAEGNLTPFLFVIGQAQDYAKQSPTTQLPHR